MAKKLLATIAATLGAASASLWCEDEIHPQIQEWLNESAAIDRVLAAGEWEAALRNSNEILVEMSQMLVSRGSELIGNALVQRAVAQQGIGENDDAAWDAWVASELWQPARESLERYGAEGLALLEALSEEPEIELDLVADSGLGLVTLSSREEEVVEGPKGEVLRPKKIHAPPPMYPVGLRQARVEAVVVVETIIDTNGRPRRPRVIKSGLHPTLVLNAMEAVKRWRFRPATAGGEPVEVEYTLSVNFAMR